MTTSSSNPLTFHSRALRGGDAVLYFLALAFPILLVAYGVWRVLIAYYQFGPAAVQSWGQPWFIAAAWAAIPLFLLTVRGIWLARRSVVITKNGLQFTGLRYTSLSWQQISGLAVEDTRYHLLRLTIRTHLRVTLIPTTGKPLTLDNRFENLPKFAETLKKHLYPRLLPPLREQLNAGQWLYFGPLRFNRSQLEIHKHGIPWEQVTAVYARAGWLMIEFEQQKTRRIPTAHLPNLELLLQVIEENIIAP